MKEIEKILIDKHKDFWEDISDIEKKEIIAFKKYIDYIQKDLKCRRLENDSYKGVLNFLMKRHLEYLNEAFLSLSLSHYNSFVVYIKKIIQNYVDFIIIKENKNKYIWRDWYLWERYKSLEYIKKHPNCSREMYLSSKKDYENICAKLGVGIDYISSNESYGWLKRIYKLSSYRFKKFSDQIDKKIYKDFCYYNSYDCNNDMFLENNQFRRYQLSIFMYTAYEYTHKIIEAYNYHFITRKEYSNLCVELCEIIDKCKNYESSFSN